MKDWRWWCWSHRIPTCVPPPGWRRPPPPDWPEDWRRPGARGCWRPGVEVAPAEASCSGGGGGGDGWMLEYQLSLHSDLLRVLSPPTEKLQLPLCCLHQSGSLTSHWSRSSRYQALIGHQCLCPNNTNVTPKQCNGGIFLVLAVYCVFIA